jgi:hypothetical protein
MAADVLATRTLRSTHSAILPVPNITIHLSLNRWIDVSNTELLPVQRFFHRWPFGRVADTAAASVGFASLPAEHSVR